MKRIASGVLVGFLLIGLGLPVLAGQPEVRAHGEFWADFHFAGQRFDMQFSFCVQDRGENDHGNLSMRIFDHWTGKLVAVGVTYGRMDVFTVGDWVLFVSALRTTYFDEDYYLPLHIPEFLFQAYDGGMDDQFKLMNAPLSILEGKIVIR